VFIPVASLAAITPYFVAANDTLLAFNDSTMPFVSGRDILVPDKTFEGAGVWSVSSTDLELVQLYRGNRHVDFYTATGEVYDQDGNILNWPAARRIGSRFYVPARQVCEHFGLTYQVLEVPHNVIPEERMRVIRIVSTSTTNGATFVGLNERALRTAYNEYYTPAPPPPTPPPPPPTPPPQPPPQDGDEQPPDYKTITIYLSFFDISAGSVESVLSLFDYQVALIHQASFFVSADDIKENPGVIRRISGSGHTIGIWLNEGTHQEYLEASALLFEAAKVRTVIVSASDAAETAADMADAYGLIYRDGTENLADNDTRTAANVIAMLPAEEESRYDLIFPCSGHTAMILSGIYTHLRVNEYNIATINELTEPIE